MITKKAHYLINQLKGFKNINNDKVQYIEQDGNNLIITMLINPTNDSYLLTERIETIITYNLKTDAYKIVCKGKGSKKYNSKVKHTAETILKGRIAEAQKMEQSDISDALYMTIEYYYNQLKELITDKKELAKYANKLHYKAVHECQTVQEIEAVFNEIKNKLNKNNEQQNNQQTTQKETTYIVGNRAFSSITEAEEYCLQNDFDPQLMIKKMEDVPSSQETTIEEKEIFYLYNNTFNTYQEAYNYAIENDIKLNMILSSKHPFMTNERLQELENIYTFSRHTFTLEDAQEYCNYLNTIPETSDSYERICKLKSIINRLESRQRRLQEKEAEDRRKAQAIDKMLNDLYNIGMTRKEWSTHVTYFLNDQPIYTWFTGITTDKMYNELLEVYNKYFKTSQAG
jgi:uncharacterized coiled-coil DUF342 family protein